MSAAPDVWSARAEAFGDRAYGEGRGLDFLVELCEPAPGVTALDVATGGGHVARFLRDAGCTVVTADPAPGMRPDVICRAEDLPFADASFDVVVCRNGAHHFEDVRAAFAELARVSRRLVVVGDLLYEDERFEAAHRERDPTHVRALGEEEWRQLYREVGLEVERLEVRDARDRIDRWLERVDCRSECAERVRSLLADRMEDEWVPMRFVFVKGRKAGS